MKAILISCLPERCELIASGKMKADVRETRPKLETPFKVYICCTNGKVMGECTCDRITSFRALGEVQALYNELQETCISHDEIVKYANGKRIYYWHISDLVIYDKPKGLSDFVLCGVNKIWSYKISLKKPPKSWCYVEERSRP